MTKGVWSEIGPDRVKIFVSGYDKDQEVEVVSFLRSLGDGSSGYKLVNMDSRLT
jgi:hypothetical protein